MSEPAAAGATRTYPAHVARARWWPILRESLMAGALVFALALALVGIETADVSGGLALVFHFDQVLAAAVSAFLGRIAWLLLRERQALPVLLGAGTVSVWLGIELQRELLGAGGGWLPFSGSLPNVLLASFALWLAARAAYLMMPERQRVSRGAEVEAVDMARRNRALRYFALGLGVALLLAALTLPFFPFVDRRILDIGILVLTYVMLGWGLNIVVGLAGLLDLGYVAFYAVGAYSYALLALHFDMGFWMCLPLAGILSAFAGILLGFPVLRLRGDYLAIVTLGFGEIIRIVLLNWYQFTGGPDGLSGIPRPTFFGLPFQRYPEEGAETFHTYFGLEFASVDRIIFLYYLILGLALLTNWFTLRIRRLPVGRAWEALREDEIACRSLGINPTKTKLTAFSLGAMFGGFGGSFFATRQGFISPESFTFIESAIILAIVVLGGMGSQLGVALAAVVLIGLPEFFRDLQQYRMLAFGAAMVVIMVWRPRGLMSHRAPTVRLPPRPPPLAESGPGPAPGARGASETGAS